MKAKPFVNSINSFLKVWKRSFFFSLFKFVVVTKSRVAIKLLNYCIQWLLGQKMIKN